MPISRITPIICAGRYVIPPGTLIIGDNVVRDGEVVNPQSADERVQGVRQFIEMMGAEPRLTATALQTVGTKGWDGFTLAWVNA